jgi:hypothetical protein
LPAGLDRPALGLSDAFLNEAAAGFAALKRSISLAPRTDARTHLSRKNVNKSKGPNQGSGPSSTFGNKGPDRAL